jgi:hypothetical protein
MAPVSPLCEIGIDRLSIISTLARSRFGTTTTVVACLEDGGDGDDKIYDSGEASSSKRGDLHPQAPSSPSGRVRLPVWALLWWGHSRAGERAATENHGSRPVGVGVVVVVGRPVRRRLGPREQRQPTSLCGCYGGGGTTSAGKGAAVENHC